MKFNLFIRRVFTWKISCSLSVYMHTCTYIEMEGGASRRVETETCKKQKILAGV